MQVIDFHCHIYPEKIAQKAVKSVGEFYNIEMTAQGTSSDLIDKGSKCSITNYVVHSVAIDKDHVQTINNYIKSECDAHKEFVGFMTMHADFENKIEEAQRCKNLGLKGVKIHPDTQKYNMDDERMYELYDYLQSEGLPLLIHCGDYRYPYSHPSRLCKIQKEFPRLITIGAHFGGWSVYDLALEYLKDTNCYLDTSSSLEYIGLKRAKELINIYGAERMLYGTDFPMWSPEEELKKFMNIGLTQSQNELILYKNAQQILKL